MVGALMTVATAAANRPPIRPHGTASIGDTKTARAPARCWMSVAMSANNVSP